MGAIADIRKLFNGPALAGVGATTDPGLVRAKYHVLPWDPAKTTQVTIGETMTGVTLSYGGKGKAPKNEFDSDDLLKYAYYNVDIISDFDDLVKKETGFTEDEITNFKYDLTAILFLMMAYGYYGDECTLPDDGDKTSLEKDLDDEEDIAAGVISVERLNRAATFVMARMHTKYQTNHAIGGSPMQASMASAVRAFYGITPSKALTGIAKTKCESIASLLHWALHPANERLLIPVVLRNTQITTAYVHTDGPEVTLVGLEEYFQLRSKTPPASTHMFYVCAAAIRQLDSIGIIDYLPEPTRVSDVATGFTMIAMYGAKLHPAARYWGLERVTSNQKLVESLCSDLGYAVRKLVPASSLANAPALQKEDFLNGGWKTFIDSLRAAMDERGKEMIDDKVFKQIQAKVAPTGSSNPAAKQVIGYLTAPPTAAPSGPGADPVTPPRRQASPPKGAAPTPGSFPSGGSPSK